VYYRIQRDSVVDMQSAILQTGAIYVSADVHEGWSLGPVSGVVPTHDNLPMIRPSAKIIGGHAFAIVGYSNRGFVVQNSWGTGWGWSGFAVLPYGDWVEHGTDAWGAALGAPVTRASQAATGQAAVRSPQYFVQHGGRVASAGQLPRWVGAGADTLAQRPNTWTAQSAYWHTVVSGNDGCILNRLPQAENEADSLSIVALEEPRKWFTAQSKTVPWRLAIYAHGGLNSEQDSIQRIRVLGPNFEANGIYPIFVTWRSGWAETISDMIADAAKGLFGGVQPPVRGIGEAVAEATDRALEAIFRTLLVRSMWAEMKENIARSSTPGRGVDGLADRLKDLSKAAGGKLEIHLLGHSAGSFVCGGLLSEFAGRALTAASCTLFAPACDLSFASEHFATAVKGGRLDRDRLFIHVLSDALERDDTVGPYRKSLLYLVSRALERRHKTPLLGLATAFDPACASDEYWHAAAVPDIEAWQAFFWAGEPPRSGFSRTGKGGSLGGLSTWQRKEVDTGAGQARSTHGSFDNSLDHIGGAIKTILGGPLQARLTPLDY
jgi:hypothetical protein